MPLYKRKPFLLMEPPKDLNPGELVYQIRFTKEILKDYQEYLNRLNLYRQRVWTCKITGKTNLTYEEALVSERRAAEKVQEFPKELMAPVLQSIQYSTLNLKDLTETIYTKLQENLLEGIELHGMKEQSVCACRILKVLETGNSTQYEVGWLDKDKKIIGTSLVNADDLIRKKPPYSRTMLKVFIRESTSQSAPWVIHEKLATKHGISTEPPEELRDKDQKATNRKRKNMANGNMTGMDLSKKKAKEGEAVLKKERIKYPIDDLLVEPAPNDPKFSDRPSFCTDFKVPMDCVGDLLLVWEFCSSFGRLLNLWRFSLEDFENAICHKDSNIVLIVESHAAFLRLLIREEGDYLMALNSRMLKSKITLVTWTEFLCNFLEMEGRAKFSDYVATIRRGHYGLLETHVKLGIFRELISEALTTAAIRNRLDECVQEQQTLTAKKKEEDKRKKEEENIKKEESDAKEAYHGGSLQNGKESSDLNGTINHHENGSSVRTPEANISRSDHVQENGDRKYHTGNADKRKKDNGSNSRNIKNDCNTNEHVKEKQRKKHKDEEENLPRTEQASPSKKHKGITEELPEPEKNSLELEIEKLSIRANPLGKDRNYNRYWFFRREGRVFVESSDSKQWGYYASKEELDAFMSSLNTKGERERALQRQLEKYYHRISVALQKRSKDVLHRSQKEEGEVRRSTRVRAKPREKPPFLRYINKWKD